jgi:hypothetical protein
MTMFTEETSAGWSNDISKSEHLKIAILQCSDLANSELY